MEITEVIRKKRPDGSISGFICVTLDSGRKCKVEFESCNGHAEQWGAPPEVLRFTYPTFEKLISQDP